MRVLQTWFVIAVSFAYLGLLFAVAFYGDRRAEAGRSLTSGGTVYALSLAVYATSWTYYGSVGRAATTGVGFLPIYLGPTIMLALGWLVLRRIIRISRRNRITSLADFVSARYGKSASLGALVAIVAAVGVVPYIALQLKAVSNTFEIIRRHPEITPTSQLEQVPLLQDTALYVTLLLAAFTIAFGTRHLDATERHEGVVGMIAFESIVKLVAFVAAGVFVTFGLYNGFGDLFGQAAQAGLTSLFTLGSSTGEWVWLTVLSMLAIFLLPRQWQIAVVENVDERHLKRAMWLTPLYMFLISIFVLPIAAAGLLRHGNAIDADTYVLGVPMAAGQQALTLLIFIGGLSAATGMIIVETVALSTMISNSVVIPPLLRRWPYRHKLAKLVLGTRRVSIVVVMLLGYAYFRLAGEGTALVSMGLVSFAAVAQFAPAILGGLFWRGGTRNGALAGLSAGFAVWVYTLLLPNFTSSGWLPRSFVDDGPFGISALRPNHLFGVDGMDNISHGMFWSMLVNIGCYAVVSILSARKAREQAQAALFVDVLADPARPRLWRGHVSVQDLRQVLRHSIGLRATDAAFEEYARDRGVDVPTTGDATADLVQYAETLLAGSVGAASARIMVASIAGEEQLRVEEVMEMLDEASQVAALEERHRLARELHDSVSQALFSMTLHTRAVELAVQKEGGDPDGPVAHGLTALRSLTHGALAEMRASLFQLRPDALREDGLAEAIRKQAAAIAAREGLDIRVIVPEYRMALDDRIEEELFRVVQEAVHNSVKHANPGRIDIVLDEAPGGIVVEVIDDGQGFDPREAPPGGMGLKGMRERMERIGGMLVINSTSGSTTVRAVLPDQSLGEKP